ncbi:MAG: hypothetical protein WCS56_04745 [Bacilli bacterium]
MKINLFKNKKALKTKQEITKHIADCFYKDVILEFGKMVEKNKDKLT